MLIHLAPITVEQEKLLSIKHLGFVSTYIFLLLLFLIWLISICCQIVLCNQGIFFRKRKKRSFREKHHDIREISSEKKSNKKRKCKSMKKKSKWKRITKSTNPLNVFSVCCSRPYGGRYLGPTTPISILFAQ